MSAHPSPDPRPAVGRLGEDAALRHLEALGYAPVARNHRTRRGEIDLIVFDGHTLAFVEVKTRVLRVKAAATGPDAGTPLQSIRAAQQRRLRRLVAAWLAETPDRPRAAQIRVDAIGVVLGPDHLLLRLDHVEGVL